MEKHPIDPSALPLITYRDRAVLTTALLAQLSGCDPQTLRDNFRSHAGRFVDGTHFFRLEGAALREFKSALLEVRPRRAGDIGVTITPSVSSLLLWTERGAARHAKLLHTDQSWEVFEALEDRYFHRENQKYRDIDARLTQLTLERDDARGHAVRMYRKIQDLQDKLWRIRDAYERLQTEHIAMLKAPAIPLRRPADRGEVEDILALYDAGKDFCEIGLIKGRTPNSVRHIVRRYRTK